MDKSILSENKVKVFEVVMGLGQIFLTRIGSGQQSMFWV